MNKDLKRIRNELGRYLTETYSRQGGNSVCKGPDVGAYHACEHQGEDECGWS